MLARFARFIKLKHGANSRQLHVDGKNRSPSGRHAEAQMRRCAGSAGRRPARNPLCSCLQGGPSCRRGRARCPIARKRRAPRRRRALRQRAQDPEAPGSDGPVPFRSYSLIATVGVVPLVLMVIALLVFQFEERASRAARGAPGPGHRAQHPAEQRDQDGGGSRLAARGLERDLRAQRRARALGLPPRRRCPAAVRWRRGAVRAQLRGARRCSGDYWLAENLIQHMQLSHEAMPYLRWSYFRSGQDDLMTIFPFADQAGLGGEVREASNDEILARFADVPLFDREAGRGRDAVLDRSLLRPCGRGLDGRLRRAGARRRALGRRGRHGSAARLRQQLRARLRLSGRPSLAVERAGPGPGGFGRPESGGPAPAWRWTTSCPRRCAGRPAHLLDSAGTFTRVGDQYVLAQPVSSTPWTLLFAASTSELNQVVLPRLVPSGIILAGLILTLLLAHLLRQRLIVRPALSFANYIHAEAGNLRPKPPACRAGGSRSPAPPPTPSRPSAARSPASRTARR